MSNRPVAEMAFDVAGSNEKLWARIYAPVLQADGFTWGSRIVIDDPIGVDRKVLGGDSLQALVSALRGASVDLYSSDVWRSGELGCSGRLGGDLGIPAMKFCLAEAPFPF